MNLINLVKNLFNLQKKLDKKKLPSQGLFYKDNFSISIKKASTKDVKEYESDYIKDNIGVIIHKVKRIVEENIILSEGYKFEDIKSIDVIFIFLEIVKFTKGKPIKFKYFNEETEKEDIVEFGAKYFNYFIIDDRIMKYYDNEEKVFEINGYKYSLPTIGVENSLTNFLIYKSNREDSELYSSYFYDFTYFLSNKSNLTFDEIENLIQIFNFDLDDKETDKIGNILKLFIPLQKYSLKKDGKVIDINAKIDLEKIWK
jgi:hypothetical protein